MSSLKRFRFAVLLHAISKGSTFAQTLIITPLLIAALGSGVFGALMVCHSLLLWTMIDTGLTESIKLFCISRLGSFRGKKFNLIVGNMFRFYLIFALLVSLLITASVATVISENLVSLRELSHIFLISIIILPSKFVRDYLIGLERSHVFYLVRFIALITTLPFILWQFYNGHIQTLTHALYSINLFSMVSSVVLVVILILDRVPIFFKSRYISKLSIGKIRDFGSKFFVIGLATFFIQDMDFVYLAQFQTGSEIAEFSLPHRFFQYIQVALSIIIVPLWPYIAAEIDSKKQAAKIVSYTKLNVGVFAGLSLIMWVISPFFLHFWGAMEFSYSLFDTLPFAVYFFCRCLCAVGILLLKLHLDLKRLLKLCIWEALLHFFAVWAVFHILDEDYNRIMVLVYLWSLITLFVRILPVVSFVGKEVKN